MKGLLSLLIIATMTLFPYCKSAKYTPSDYPKSQIFFGSGGGMTGEITEYVLFENGTVFKGKGLVDIQHEKFGKISSQTVQQLFSNYNTLQLSDVQFDEPGNRYFYFDYRSGGTTHRVSWGINRQATPKNVQLFYDLLNHAIQSL